MNECITGELLAMVAFMHHATKGHSTLKHYAALTGLTEHCSRVPPHLAFNLAHVVSWGWVRANIDAMLWGMAVVYMATVMGVVRVTLV